MTILYFGIYNSQYSRNRVILKGLRENGSTVTECKVKPGRGALLKLLIMYLRRRPIFDIMVVGFPGQEVMFLARWLTRKPIVFDAFTSHYGGYILDRQIASQRSLRARWYRFLDRWSCKFANLVLLDTNAHIAFFIREFGLPRDKFLRVFVGTDTKLFYPRQRMAPPVFMVHFHGYYIPVHGVHHIITAAHLLRDEHVSFTLIGKGKTYQSDRAYAEELGVSNIRFLDSVPYDELPDYINNADVTLGLFGNTPRIHIAIPNKVFEGLACKRAVITANTEGVRELLTHRQNAMLCNIADPEDLARTILALKQDPKLRDSIAAKGYEVFMHEATEEKLGAGILQVIHEKFSL